MATRQKRATIDDTVYNKSLHRNRTVRQKQYNVTAARKSDNLHEYAQANQPQAQETL